MNAIRKDLYLAAPVDRVWEFLTRPEKVGTWLMDSDMEAEEGSRFSFTAPPAGQWDGKIYCEVRDVIEHERLTYTWSANDIGVETLVTFELQAKQGGTHLTLTHSQMEGAMAGAAGRHAAGWTGCLKALKVALFGPDLAYDWSEFQLTYFVEAPLHEVYDMWSTMAGMKSFWADEVTCSDGDSTRRAPGDEYQVGDRVDLKFPTGGSADLEILNIEEDKFILFSFGGDYGWVRVALNEEGGRTKIVLRQFGSSEDDDNKWEVHVHARGWWLFNLVNLKSVLLHGNDLRERGQDTANAFSAVYLPGDKRAPRPHDWTSFDVYQQINATPEEVIARWQTIDGLKSFFIADMKVEDEQGQPRVASAPVEAGDKYHWQGIHEFSGEGHFLKSGPSEIAFSFGARFTVEVTVEVSGTGTLLHLHQSGMEDTADDRVHGSLNCRSCWINFLTTLKSQLEHGIDLRDLEPATADSVSVVYNTA